MSYFVMLWSLETNAGDQQVAVARLRDLDARLLDRGGQLRRGELQLVLHLDLRDVGVRSRLRTSRVMIAVPESSRRGRHVQKVIESAHLLLDHLHDGVLDRFGGRARHTVRVIWTAGGAMVGYCSIGSSAIDSAPASEIRIAMNDREDRTVDEEAWP